MSDERRLSVHNNSTTLYKKKKRKKKKCMRKKRLDNKYRCLILLQLTDEELIRMTPKVLNTPNRYQQIMVAALV